MRISYPGMTENDCHDPVIGVAFDGTGYGTDGTIWGGEILLADYEDFTRFGSITPFLQIGGDASAKEGWRIAVSMIYGYTKDRELAWKIIEKLGLCNEQESKVQFTMADRKINAVISTSVGRLFDAVSAILGIRRQSSFEGEASMALEFAAEAYEQQKCEQFKYEQQNIMQGRDEKPDRLVYEKEERFILNTRMLVQQIVEEKMQGADSGQAGISVPSGTGRADYSSLYRSPQQQWQKESRTERRRLSEPFTAAPDGRTTGTGRF